MGADQESRDKRDGDLFLDRRSGEDRREAYDLDYFELGGIERRKRGERRSKDERRRQCKKVSDWSSVCPPTKVNRKIEVNYQ
jgi:hypothetical protein